MPIPTSTAPVFPRTPVTTAIVANGGAGETSAVETPLETAASLPTPDLSTNPDFWKALPVIPIVGETPRRAYLRALELGNNPHSFSKIGDCGSTPAWFLGDFDRGSRFYNLGEHTALQAVIDQFQGSFDRTSLAAKAGFNASSIFTTIWADRSRCQKNENPIECEYRTNRPVIALIMLGTNDIYHPDQFEPQMRRLIEFSLENGVVPVLSTKADNKEGDGSINATIARLALEYDVPLWNYWRAVQDLPDGGLQEDGVHLTWGANRFDDPYAMTRAWPVRNLTALQVLDAVWAAMSE